MDKRKKVYYIHFDQIDSTATWAKKNAHLLDREHFTCITALGQTAGRGRFNRTWISPKGKNIYITFYFSLPVDYPYLMNLGQVLSLSCATVLKKHQFLPQIKWPNDLLIEGKKVAGVLCETTLMNDQLAVFLSLGLNVNMTQELLETIDQPATSLALVSGRNWNLAQLLHPIIQQLLHDLDQLKEGGFSCFHADYEALLMWKGQKILCHQGAQKIEGICHSIDLQGRLRLKLADGSLKKLVAAELTHESSF